MVVIRGGLNLNGQPISLSALENVRLTISATDLDGVTTTQEVTDLKLHLNRETTHRFHVAPRMATLSFGVFAKVKQLSTGKDIDLSYAKSFSINEIDRTQHTSDLHFAEIDGNYVLDLLGKSGEPLADRAVNVNVWHREFRNNVSFQLQTDADGRIDLGPLTDITRLTANGPSGISRSCSPSQDKHARYNTIQAAEDTAIQIPFVARREERGQKSSGALRLYELRANTITRDLTDRLKIRKRLHQHFRADSRRLLAPRRRKCDGDPSDQRNSR